MSGVRSSCAASATKRRRRPRWPLRLHGGLDLDQHLVERRAQPAKLGRGIGVGTRRLRSPPAIAAAVSTIRSTGRRPRRMIHQLARVATAKRHHPADDEDRTRRSTPARPAQRGGGDEVLPHGAGWTSVR